MIATSQHQSALDAHGHMANVQRMLEDVISHVRDDIERVNDPKAQALFETTAEVLGGLVHAYKHADEHSEPAWK